ncbi:hypothetical protein MMC22_005131 [Lobaria immixta]|nr:hypothetical protein [Lobaria immixta]
MKRLTTCQLQIQVLAVFYTKTSLVAAQAQDKPVPHSFWPSGTNATGSTTHAPLDNTSNFLRSNAIDGRTETFWNDNTPNVFPDILTIDVSSPIILEGIMLLSSQDGWPQEYTVETHNGSDWIVRESVAGYNNALRLIAFPRSLVYPLIASSDSDITVLSTLSSGTLASASSTTAPSSSADSPTSGKKTNVGAIAGGVCGGVVATVTIVALIARIWLPRKQNKKKLLSIDPPTPFHIQSEAPPELMDHPAELQSRMFGKSVDATYERPELATSGFI